MWNRFHTAADAFGLGICVEYIIRVEASIYPIFIGSVLLISVLLDFYMDYLNKKKAKLLQEVEEETIQEIEEEVERLTLPKPWMVYEAGQDPLHMLWYVQVVNFDDLADKENENPRQIYVEEADSYEDALEEIISRIKLGNEEVVFELIQSLKQTKNIDFYNIEIYGIAIKQQQLHIANRLCINMR